MQSLQDNHRGFEQANKYVIMDPNGTHVGFMAEEESGIAKIVARQWFHTHRAFTTHVFDKHENEILKFHRPFSWINSTIRVFDPVDPNSFGNPPSVNSALLALAPSCYRIIGEAQQQWHLWRRKYNLFLYNDPPNANRSVKNVPAVGGQGGYFSQFAYIDEPWLSWDFSLLSEQNQLIGSVNRNFAGFGREIFTDTGVYALRMDAATVAAEPRHLISKSAIGHPHRSDSTNTCEGKDAEGFEKPASKRGMTLDERAVMLAAAVSVDFDYFSRNSGHGGGVIPFGVFGGENNSGNNVGEGAGAGIAGGVAGGTMREMMQSPSIEDNRPLHGGGGQMDHGQYPWHGAEPHRDQKEQSPSGDEDGWWPFDDE